jgi:hypothetical protein
MLILEVPAQLLHLELVLLLLPIPTSGEDIAKIDIYESVVSGGTSNSKPITGYPKTSKFKTSTTDSDNIIYTPANTTTPVNINFTVTDSKGATSSKTVTINGTGTGTGTEIATYTAKMLGNQKSGTGSYYSTSSDQVFDQAQALVNSSNVDFVHYFGFNNGATIAAPSDKEAEELTAAEDLATRNTTSFTVTTMTTAEFDAVTATDIVTKAGSPNTGAATKLTIGKVVAFKTAAGKFGLFKVTDLTGSNTTSGAITIDVKVQK